MLAVLSNFKIFPFILDYLTSAVKNFVINLAMFFKFFSTKLYFSNVKNIFTRSLYKI